MKGIRIGICALVAFSVVAHGAVEPWSEAVLEIGAALLLLGWGLLFATGSAPALRWNWLLAPIIGLWSWGLVQYFGGLTAVSYASKIELLMLSALVILMFLAVQAFETREHWTGFVWFLLGLCFFVSMLGILQHFTFNGKLYWFRELRYGGIPFGPYVNRNHFAGFIELTVPAGLSLLMLRVYDRGRMSFVSVLTLLPIGALFLSASRGGMTSFSVQVGLIVVLAFVYRRGRHNLGVVAMILLLGCALVAWLGVGRALDRFTSYRQLEVTESRRTEMSRDAWRIFLDHPVKGTGVGTLQEVFPQYESIYDGVTVDHVHNDYVEGLAETGLIGGVFGAMFLVILFWQGWLRLKAAKNPLNLAFHVGALTACSGLLVHSVVDFNFHIPSNALLFLLQAVLATSAVAGHSLQENIPRNQV